MGGGGSTETEKEAAIRAEANVNRLKAELNTERTHREQQANAERKHREELAKENAKNQQLQLDAVQKQLDMAASHQKEKEDMQEKFRREEMDRQYANHQEKVQMLQGSMDEQIRSLNALHAKDMEEFRRQNAEAVKQHQENINALLKEIDQFKEEPFDPKDPDRLMRKQGENFNRFCEAARTYLENVPKLRKTSVAVLGPSGVGKSTIINVFAGRKVTEVDVVECTQEISMVHASEEYDMYDVPGSRDERADFYNIDNLHKLKSLHLILVVYTDRFEHVLNVAKLLRSIDLPHIFVRNKCNFARDAEGLKRGLEKEKASAGEVPLIYLGYADKEGDVPQHSDELKGTVKAVLEAARGLHG